MDIELFSRIIRDLLAANEKAHVPNFGTFAIVEIPATFSDKGFTVNPPYYRVEFNPSLEDDGEFLRLYAQANDMDSTMAKKFLAGFLEDFKTELFNSKSIVLPGLGRFKLASGNFLIFVQDEDLKILPRLDSLQPVSLKSLAYGGAQEASTFEEEPRPEPEAVAVPERKSEKKQHRKPGAFTILVLTVLFALALLAVLGRLCPQFVDSFLYDSHQLEILNTEL